MLFLIAGLGFGVFVASLSGCGGETAQPQGITTFEDALRAFYDEWFRFLAEEGRSPKHWDELLLRMREQGRKTETLERVRNEQYDVAWGRVPADVPGDPANAPLAFKEGGPTLYFDGHVE